MNQRTKREEKKEAKNKGELDLIFKEDKKQKLISWTSLFASIVFFCNPDTGIIDILPDFVGYMLLCVAISKTADIDDRINEAYTLFKRMVYISAAKFVALFLQFGFIPTTDQSVSMLLLSFIYSVAELMIVIPAIIKLYDGILYLSSRNGGEAAYIQKKSIFALIKKNGISEDTGRGYGNTITEKFRTSTIVFIIAKSVLRTLPEFASLSEHGYDESFWGRIHLFVGPLRMIAIMIATVFAVIWLVGTLKYISKIKNDLPFIQNLNTRYSEYMLTQIDRPARKSVKNSFGLFGVAAVLSLDFYMDNINLLPDILSVICIVVGLFVIRKYISEWKLSAVFAVLYAGCSVSFTVFEYKFNTEFYSEAIYRDPATYEAYLWVCVLAAITAIAFAICVAVLGFTVIRKIIVNYTGFSMTTNDTYDPSEKIRYLHKALTSKIFLPTVFAVLSGVAAILSRVFVNEIEFGWMIEFSLTAIYAITFIKLLSEINEQIDYKYMLS